jgi:hypothetical protein
MNGAPPMISNAIHVPLLDSILQGMELAAPPSLHPTLEANSHLTQRFWETIVASVKSSFEHPETAVRHLTHNEVKHRFALCFETIRVAYFEEKVSLIQCLDILPATLFDLLRAGVNIGDLTDGRGQTDNARRWGVPGMDQAVEVDRAALTTEDLNRNCDSLGDSADSAEAEAELE